MGQTRCRPRSRKYALSVVVGHLRGGVRKHAAEDLADEAADEKR